MAASQATAHFLNGVGVGLIAAALLQFILNAPASLAQTGPTLAAAVLAGLAMAASGLAIAIRRRTTPEATL